MVFYNEYDTTRMCALLLYTLLALATLDILQVRVSDAVKSGLSFLGLQVPAKHVLVFTGTAVCSVPGK